MLIHLRVQAVRVRCNVCLLIATDQPASLLLRGEPRHVMYESSCDCTCTKFYD